MLSLSSQVQQPQLQLVLSSLICRHSPLPICPPSGTRASWHVTPRAYPQTPCKTKALRVKTESPSSKRCHSQDSCKTWPDKARAAQLDDHICIYGCTLTCHRAI